MKTGLARLLVLASLHALWSCSSSPQAPSGFNGPTVMRLDVSGPGELAPGGAAQFRAILRFADGTSRDVTDSATWQSNQPSVLGVTAQGLASGVAVGDGLLTVSADGQWAYKPVVVVPAGTYRLTVRVRDAEQPTAAVEAAVDVFNEDGVLLPSVGDRFYGAHGRVSVRALAGFLYLPSVETVDVTGHQTVDVLLEPDRSVDVSGTYSLVVTASASCAQRLPEPLRVRTFAASITQQRLGLLTVRVSSGGSDVGSWSQDTFFGQVVDPTRVEFDVVTDSFGLGPGLVEPLAGSASAYALYGHVSAAKVDGQVTGLLEGEVQVISSVAPGEVTACTASDHGFSLTRQSGQS